MMGMEDQSSTTSVANRRKPFQVRAPLCAVGSTRRTHLFGSPGANWIVLGSGRNGRPYALVASGRKVHAGGRFTEPGGTQLVAFGEFEDVLKARPAPGVDALRVIIHHHDERRAGRRGDSGALLFIEFARVINLKMVFRLERLQNVFARQAAESKSSSLKHQAPKKFPRHRA